MRIDKLIEKLEKIQSKYGLVDVTFYDFEWGRLEKIRPSVYKHKDGNLRVLLNDYDLSLKFGDKLPD